MVADITLVMTRLYDYLVDKLYNRLPAYIPADIVYRSPLLISCREPPQQALFRPFIRRSGRLVWDIYNMYIGRTRGGKLFAYNPRYVVNPLLLIVGTSGSGKTATMTTLLASLLTNYNIAENVYNEKDGVAPIIVLDPEGEYELLAGLVKPTDVMIVRLGEGAYINIFERPSRKIHPIRWYNRIMSIVFDTLDITSASVPVGSRVFRTMVNKVARQRGFTDDPSTWDKQDITLEEIFKEIVNFINIYESKTSSKSRREDKMYEGASTLYNRLVSMMEPPQDTFSRTSTVDLKNFWNYKLVILNASKLSREMYGLLSKWLVTWFYEMMLEKGQLPSFKLRTVLAIDEAWSVLKTGEREESKTHSNPIEELSRRARKYGIMLILSTQTPEDVSREMFSLMGAVAVGSIPSEEMTNKLLRSRGIPPQKYESLLKTLGRGKLLWHINWSNKKFKCSKTPIVVDTDYPFIEKVLIT